MDHRIVRFPEHTVYSTARNARSMFQAHLEAIRHVTACLEAGQYRTHVGARFSLAQLAEAHEAQDSGSLDGKILIDRPR